MASICSQATGESFGKEHLKLTKARVAYAQVTPRLGLHSHPLYIGSIGKLFYADASFANNAEYTTQLGYIVLLTDHSAHGNPIHNSSYNSQRVVRSILGGEHYAPDDAAGVDHALLLNRDMESAMSKNVSVVVLTDSLSLINEVIRSSTFTTQKGIMIDIEDVREAYEISEILEIGWIRLGDNAVHAFKKQKRLPCLDHFLRSGRIQADVEQWVKRTTEESETTRNSNTPLLSNTPPISPACPSPA